MTEQPSRVTVLGAGAWGTTLALVIARAGHSVTLWSHSEGVAEAIRTQHENTRYLPGIFIPGSIDVTHHLADAARDAAILVSVVPSHAVREVYHELRGYVQPDQLLVSATKGIEAETYKRISEVIADELGPSARIGVLSGPSFAQEVAAGRIRWVVGEQRATGLGGLPGDTRTGSKAAMAAVAEACTKVTLPSSTATAAATGGGAGASSATTTLYDCQGRAATLASAGTRQAA